MIELDSISKTYTTEETETRALRDVSLSIGTGEFVAVMGPSGCGKSTLMNVLGMIDRPTAGQYRFEDNDVSRFSEKELVEFRKKSLGFVFQNFNLIDEMSVEENIALPLLYRGIPRRQRKSRVREALELVGLVGRGRHRPTQLSGGQQQRVAVARAVIADPKLILADEPTGNLDSANGAEVMNLLTLLNQDGATILMVTHSTEEAALAGRVIAMKDGRVQTDRQAAAGTES